MNHEGPWCHDCDAPVGDWTDFVRHADQGHAITGGRCRGACQFRTATIPDRREPADG